MFFYYLDLARRRLLADAGLVVLTIAILSLGVGASMATTALFHGLRSGMGNVDQRTLHIQLDARPINERGSTPMPETLSYEDAIALNVALKGAAWTSIVAGNWLPTSLSGDNALTMQTTQAVESYFFTMFHPPMRFGTAWSANADEQHERVAVLSSETNARFFGGKNSVGRSINIDGRLFRVIGVLAPWNPRPRYFYLGNDPYSSPRGLYLPFSSWLELPTGYGYGAMTCWNDAGDAGFSNPKHPDCAWIHLWAHPKDGHAIEEVHSAVASYASDAVKRGHLHYLSDARLLSISAWLDQEKLYPPVVKLKAAISWAVLIVCLMTASGLLAARFARRRRELALRRALGATWTQVLHQCMVEVAAVGVLAGLLSIPVAWAGLLALRAQTSNYAKVAHLDGTVITLTVGVALLAAMVAGILPAFRTARRPVMTQVKL